MAKVNLTKALSDEYLDLFNTCVIDPGTAAQVEGIVDKLLSHQQRYETVANEVNIPWYFIAVIHNMESSQSFTRHLHNGDPLTARTKHVPENRPKEGEPPFTWEESAEDALRYEKLHLWSQWHIAGLLYKIEGYNGWGYRLYHAHVKSPYLWGYSNHYASGKYVADGTWSDTAVSKQCGAAVILRRLCERGVIQIPEADIPRPIATAINNEKPILVYSARSQKPYAKELQEFLNQFPGVYLKPDGWPGKKTSDAFKKVTGYYLSGDPRI